MMPTPACLPLFGAERIEAFRGWLATLIGHGFAHGEDLVLAMPNNEGNYYAEKMLEAAARRGWIVRGARPTPTPQQRFFSVMAIGCSDENEAILRSGTEYGYSPTSHPEMMTWLYGEGAW